MGDVAVGYTMDVSLGEKGFYTFGPFRLDPRRRTLLCNGANLALTGRLFDTLLYLVQHPERLVTREELEHAVWRGRIVEDGNLRKAISALRRTVREAGAPETFIVTVPGRGFQFVAPVTFEPGTAVNQPAFEAAGAHAPRAAKSSKPRLPATLPRRRVFATLDRLTERRMVWVSGPPGAGKTTAICSYLDSREAHCLWFVVDAGDDDPAGFFFHLREAARIWATDAAPLPLLTAEYLADLSGFTRRFFRALIARLPENALFVFDNFQEVPETAALGGILRDAAGELGAGTCIVVISRQPPPAVFARLRANQDMAVLGWESLQLTEDETREIVARHTPALAHTAAEIHARSAGWAAGLTLLLEAGEAGFSERLGGADDPPQAIFDYFATEIFHRAPEQTRRVWLSTAYLPYFTAGAATSLSGEPGAARLLENLAQRRYFADRHVSGEVQFRYHALFQAFLASQADGHFPADERLVLLRRSAELAGDTETALTLFERAGDSAAAVSLLLREAPDLFAQGRWKTLLAWLQRQPPEVLEEHPWLTYWMGACQGQADLQAGFTTMEQANLQFIEAGDPVGQAMSACALVENRLLHGVDLAGTADRLAFLAKLSQAEIRLPTQSMELRVGAVLLSAFTYFDPQHGQVAPTLDRVWSLCLQNIGAGDRLMAAATILLYLAWCGHMPRARAAIEAFETLTFAPETTPLQRCNWYFSKAFALLSAGDVAEWKITWRTAAAIAHENGLMAHRLYWPLFEIWECLLEGRLEDAATLLFAEQTLAEHDSLDARGFVLLTAAWLSLLRDEPGLACEQAEKCLAVVGSNRGYVASIRSVVVLNHLALSLAGCGRAEEAIAMARQASAWFGPSNVCSNLYLPLLTEADTLLNIGRTTEGLVVLAKALAIGRSGGHFMTIPWLPKMMARLCTVALREGIETDYVEDLAARRNLTLQR